MRTRFIKAVTDAGSGWCPQTLVMPKLNSTKHTNDMNDDIITHQHPLYSLKFNFNSPWSSLVFFTLHFSFLALLPLRLRFRVHPCQGTQSVEQHVGQNVNGSPIGKPEEVFHFWGVLIISLHRRCAKKFAVNIRLKVGIPVPFEAIRKA